MNTDEAFKIPLLQHGTRFLVGTSGSQIPLYSSALTEFQRLTTGDAGSPQSIMLNPKTNGQKGVTVMVIGNYHKRLTARLQKAAYAGNKAEMLWFFHTASINGSVPHSINASIVAGATLNDIYVKHSAANYSEDYNGVGLVVLDMYGSRFKKELIVRSVGSDNAGVNTVFSSTRFVERMGNDEIPLTWDHASNAIVKNPDV